MASLLKVNQAPRPLYIVAMPSLEPSPPPNHPQWLTSSSTLHAARGGSEEKGHTPSLQEVPESCSHTLPSHSIGQHSVTWPHLPGTRKAN